MTLVRNLTLGQDVVLGSNNNIFLNASNYADLPAALAALPGAGGVVFCPAGTYTFSSSLDLGLTKSIVGESRGLTILNYTGSAHAVNIGVPGQTGAPLECKNRISDLTITGTGAVSGAADTTAHIGVRVTKCLFPMIERVSCEAVTMAYKLDGGDLWIASGLIYHPRTTGVKFGMLLTADSGKQVNDMTVVGGYIYGSGSNYTDAYGIKVAASCDTNRFLGASVEGFAGTSAKGFWVTSQVAQGQVFSATRSEACTTHFLLDSGTTGNAIYGHSELITDSSNGGNNIVVGPSRRASVRIEAYAATVTPDCDVAEVWQIGALTGNITIANPTNAGHGQRLTFLFQQDAVGLRTTTFGSKFRPTGVWTPGTTTANTRNTISFQYSSTLDLWLQTSATTGLAA